MTYFVCNMILGPTDLALVLVSYTPYSKMAAASDDLGRVARERGIEGHYLTFTCLHVVV